MTVREIALQLLQRQQSSDKYSNLALRSHLADSLDGRDRGFLAALFYTAVEHGITYDYWISALAERSIGSVKESTRLILHLGLCQIAHMSAVADHVAVNETVKLAKNKGEAAFVNALLRKAARAAKDGTLPYPDRKKSEVRYLSVFYSCSADIVKALVKELGEQGAEAILRHFNSYRATDLTVNTVKISRDAYLQRLRDAGYSAEPSAISSVGVTVLSSVDPRELPGYAEGLFIVQDGACALSAEVLGLESGMSAVDVCAAPGGKSIAAAILSGDGASIKAFDIHESKLSLITDSTQRLGISSVTVEQRDAKQPDGALLGSVDRVICDVPCSGLGVLGKKSDMRYKSLDSLDELQDLQYSILEASSGYLRIGGRMVYSTCTLRSEENADVVRRFTDAHSGFVLREFELGGVRSEGGMLTLLPHIHNTDGFFIALIERRK